MSIFLHGKGLPCHRSLIGLHIHRKDYTPIRWNTVSCRKNDHISGDDLLGGNVHFFTIAKDDCGRRRHPFEGIDGFLGPKFLDESKQHRKNNNHGNRDCFYRMPQRSRDSGTEEQDHREDIAELCK